MGAVNTPTGHQMRANCGKACNHHTLHWLVKPLQGCNRQNVQIFSFHPRSAGGVASVTWRLTVLSRMLFPSFSLVLHSNSARWDWPSRVDLELSGIGFGSLPSFLLFFVHPIIRYAFHKLPLKEIHFYIWLFHWNCSKMTVFLLWFINPRQPVTPHLYAAKVVFTKWKRTKFVIGCIIQFKWPME